MRRNRVGPGRLTGVSPPVKLGGLWNGPDELAGEFLLLREFRRATEAAGELAGEQQTLPLFTAQHSG